jgi:hypothetical protein
MSGDSSRDARRDLFTLAGAVGLGALLTTKIDAATQDEPEGPQPKRGFRGAPNQEPDEKVRSRRISHEVVVGSSVAKAPDYDAAKKYSLIQVIEHVFKQEEDVAAGYPVKQVQEFKIMPATKLALVTISGFECWFGTSAQEATAAASRYGIHAGLEANFDRAILNVSVRANLRFWGRRDWEWTWRCHVVVQCFGDG